MIFNEPELDNLVHEILGDCREVDPPLDRNEIARHVIDHLNDQIHKYVFASLERLVQEGRVLNDGAPAQRGSFRYWLPPVDVTRA